MKRTTALLLAAILCLWFAACSKAPEPEQSPQETYTEAADTEGSEEMQGQSGSSIHNGDAAEPSKEPVQRNAGLDGQMSWYIGSEGWHGTYTVEDGVIHAQLTSDLERSQQLWDFLVVIENETAELEMDYGDMTICWAYGEQESPANGADNG